MFVVWVTLLVQLEARLQICTGRQDKATNQLQYCDLHHTLVEVRRFIFHHLDCHDLVCLHILAFYHLTKGSLAKNVEDEVSGHVIDKLEALKTH